MTVRELRSALFDTSHQQWAVVLQVEGVGSFEIVEAKEGKDAFILKISQNDEAELMREPDFNDFPNSRMPKFEPVGCSDHW